MKQSQFFLILVFLELISLKIDKVLGHQLKWYDYSFLVAWLVLSVIFSFIESKKANIVTVNVKDIHPQDEIKFTKGSGSLSDWTPSAEQLSKL